MEASGFDLSGALRRIRRRGDLSQRELAAAAGISPSTLAHAEAASRDLPVAALVRAAAVAGLRLALVDGDGTEVSGMGDGTVRDLAGRRFPAHLDTWLSDASWPGPARTDRPEPSYTFDRSRERRDDWRGRLGTPEDHRLPQAGDSPQERRAARQRAAWEHKRQELERRREAGELHEAEPFTCECPQACDELDDWSGKPVHAPECACGCDLG